MNDKTWNAALAGADRVFEGLALLLASPIILLGLLIHGLTIVFARRRDRRLKPLVETGTGSIACDESAGSASAEIAQPPTPGD